MPNLSSFSRQLKEILKGKRIEKDKEILTFSHKRRVFVTKKRTFVYNIYTLRKVIKNKITITREQIINFINIIQNEKESFIRLIGLCCGLIQRMFIRQQQ